MPILSAAVAAALLDSRYRLDVRRYNLYSKKLPSGFNGFRIVQLSDLHGAEFGAGNCRLIKTVAGIKPDIIAMTGDFIEGDRGTDCLCQLEQLLLGLRAIAPVYYINGNHEWLSGSVSGLEEMLQRLGVTYLRNDCVRLYSGGSSIILCGLEEFSRLGDGFTLYKFISDIRSANQEDYILMLAHRNNWAETYKGLDVDAILCGHGHGGIIRLPMIGGLIGVGGDIFPRYTGGHYRTRRYDLIISRGLGPTRPLEIPRFLNSPHIPVIQLNCEEN